MKIQLIQGEFAPQDALDIVTQMIQTKIRYHEAKIRQDLNEEDIKNRESKIKNLQNELFCLRKDISLTSKMLQVHATVQIE